MKICKCWAVLMAVVMVVSLSLSLASCGGGGAKVQTEQATYTTTLGKELQDLDEAYKKGLINEKQYDEAKKKLIEQRTKGN